MPRAIQLLTLAGLNGDVIRAEVKSLAPRDGGGFSAEDLDLPGCISDGETPQMAFDNLLDARRSWLARHQSRPFDPG